MKPGALERTYFPYTTTWRQVFRIRFPRVAPDGRSTLASGTKWVGLRFAGAQGNEELRWTIDSDAARRQVVGANVAPEGSAAQAIAAEPSAPRRAVSVRASRALRAAAASHQQVLRDVAVAEEHDGPRFAGRGGLRSGAVGEDLVREDEVAGCAASRRAARFFVSVDVADADDRDRRRLPCATRTSPGARCAA